MNLKNVEKELYVSKKKGKKVSSRKKIDGKIKKEIITVPPKRSELRPDFQSTREEFDEVNSDLDKREINASNKWVKRILWTTGILVILIAGGGIFFISEYNNGSVRDVQVEVSDIKKVRQGEIFELDFEINNKSENPLGKASLTLNLPAGIILLNSLNNSNLLREPIGDIASGNLTKRTYKFLAVGEDKSVQIIGVKLAYVLGNSDFEVQKNKEILIEDSVIELTFEKPDQVFGGSAFDVQVKYKNIADHSISDLIMGVEYPNSFHFISSDIEPESLKNRWRLGELKSGSSGSLEIKGSLENYEGSAINLPFTFYTGLSGKNYKIAEETAVIKIAPSPISIETSLNGSQDYAARIGDKLNYSIGYKNNSGIALADVVIKANLQGELFDLTSLETNGFFEPVSKTLTWNFSNISLLRLLDPGAGGEVRFSVKLKPQFPIQRLNDKNFYLKLNVEINSPSVPYYLSALKTKAVANLNTKVAGLTTVDAKAFYWGENSSISNTGPFPPKVGEATEYTAHWILRNFGTDVSNVKLSAILPTGVEWKGVSKSNVATVPVYNEVTREVTWEINKILATKGVLNEPVEAVFQIKATPESSEIGQYKRILEETRLTATDDFTGLELSGGDTALTTQLPDDKTVGEGSGKVIQ